VAGHLASVLAPALRQELPASITAARRYFVKSTVEQLSPTRVRINVEVPFD
jgi:hypothetical protein